MNMMPTKFEQQVILNMGGLAIFNEKTGTLRYCDAGNDVLDAISRLGGLDKAAKILGVKTNDINQWIDEYYVPDVYAELIRHITNYSIWTLQQPPHWTSIDGKYWPPSGYIAEKNRQALMAKHKHD
jgi:hypothetical protein